MTPSRSRSSDRLSAMSITTVSLPRRDGPPQLFDACPARNWPSRTPVSADAGDLSTEMPSLRGSGSGRTWDLELFGLSTAPMTIARAPQRSVAIVGDNSGLPMDRPEVEKDVRAAGREPSG